MNRLFWAAVPVLLFATVAVARDEQPSAPEVQVAEAQPPVGEGDQPVDEAAGTAGDEAEHGTADTATNDAGDDAPADDSDLDEQTYEGDDDDFVPSEEIPADQAIPFPSNI